MSRWGGFKCACGLHDLQLLDVAAPSNRTMPVQCVRCSKIYVHYREPGLECTVPWEKAKAFYAKRGYELKLPGS